MKTWIAVLASTLVASGGCRGDRIDEARQSQSAPKPVESTATPGVERSDTVTEDRARPPGDVNPPANTATEPAPAEPAPAEPVESSDPTATDTPSGGPLGDHWNDTRTSDDTWGTGAGETATTPDRAATDYDQREAYRVRVRDRLDRLEARLHELESRTDAASRQAAADLRTRRDELSVDFDRMKAQTRAGWAKFRSKLSAKLDTLERDLNDTWNHTRP